MKETTSMHLLEVNAIKKCIEIANSQFGNGFITELELLNTIKSDQRFGLVSKTDNVISGFVLASICNTIGDLKPILISNQNWFDTTYEHKFPIALIQTISVSENHTGLGIGKQLINAILNQINRLSKTTLSLVWEHQNGTPLAHILDQCGLKMQLRIDNYWYYDSIQNNYDCKYCGTPPCQCTMMVYSD
jgi:ribosomal protein S18 acetylase RimI-like enzyme